MMAAEGKKVWMDGRLVDFADAKVHVLNHTLHYGVGVFEGIRGYETAQGPAIFRPIVYRGEPALGVKNSTGKVSLAIAAIPAKKYLGESSEAGIRAKISPFRKPRSDAIPSFAKAAGNYVNSYLAGVDAQKDGYEEA